MKFSANKLLFLILILFSIICCLGACSGGGGGGSTTLSAPSQVVAYPMPGSDHNGRLIMIKWTPVENATSYNVYFSATPGVTKSHYDTLLANKLNYAEAEDEDGIQNGIKYYFVVTAVNSNGESEISKEVSATPSATPPPPPPQDIAAESKAGGVLISWTASGATAYTIYYRTTPGVTKTNGIPVANAVSPQEVSGLLNNTTYYFVATATNANGESTTSFEVSAIPLASPPPLRPTGVTITEGNAQATLSWSAVAGATSYNVYYTSDKFMVSQTYEKATKLPKIAALTVTVNGLKNNVAYFFVVTAVNGNGKSADSTVVSATPIAAKPVPAMVKIDGGTFQMGDSLDGLTYALPVHTVNINTFYIDKYSTTYDLWTPVYNWAITNGYTFDHSGTNGSNGFGTNMPVTNVSFYDVVKWLNARSEKEGRTPVYYTDNAHANVYKTGQVTLTDAMVNWTANGYRLPTEAEWEKAARGGLVGLRYPWGNNLSPDKANYSEGMTTSVGVYPANGFGLYDMAGNVYQWVWDWGEFSAGYADPLYTNPDTHGPAMGPSNTRVRRGGAWAEGEEYLKCAERVFRAQTYTGPYFGFRSASNTP